MPNVGTSIAARIGDESDSIKQASKLAWRHHVPLQRTSMSVPLLRRRHPFFGPMRDRPPLLLPSGTRPSNASG